MSTKIDRRSFLKNSAIAGVGAPLILNNLFMSNLSAITMSSVNTGLPRNLTAVAITQDCMRLTGISASISNAFKKSLVHSSELITLGALLKNGEKHIIPTLTKCRTLAKEKDNQEKVSEKLAFFSGWLVYREVAATLYENTEIQDSLNPSDQMIYHDVAILKAMQPENEKAVSEAEFLTLLDMIDRRNQIRFHTLKADMENIDDWVVNIVKWRESFKQLFSRYAKAYCNPDTAKLGKYVTKTNFYNREDSVIKLATALEKGYALNNRDLESALKDRSKKSLYSQALIKSYMNVHAASDFFTDTISENKFKTLTGIA